MAAAQKKKKKKKLDDVISASNDITIPGNIFGSTVNPFIVITLILLSPFFVQKLAPRSENSVKC